MSQKHTSHTWKWMLCVLNNLCSCFSCVFAKPRVLAKYVIMNVCMWWYMRLYCWWLVHARDKVSQTLDNKIYKSTKSAVSCERHLLKRTRGCVSWKTSILLMVRGKLKCKVVSQVFVMRIAMFGTSCLCHPMILLQLSLGCVSSWALSNFIDGMLPSVRQHQHVQRHAGIMCFVLIGAGVVANCSRQSW